MKATRGPNRASQERVKMGDQLREIICESGHTAYSLSQLSDVAEEVIRRFMNGTRDLKLETADRLAEALGVAPLTAARRRSGR
ncbi:helix-turn-helix domain-containing protein [Singulisphaera sp. PoT]|uniref:helix-turn-helix domain-containing protein n=1 Tax=Singulisphaera sp. PoT TaxID=3411797 RepID=UPI003BF50D08